MLTIGKKFYKGGTKKTVDEIKNLMNDLKVLNRFIDKKETIESFMERCFNTKSTKFLLGYSIVLKYEIADKYCNEKDLKSIFYDKTLQGTSIFNYNEWFKNKVFK